MAGAGADAEAVAAEAGGKDQAANRGLADRGHPVRGTHGSAEESRQVAEQARQTEWAGHGLLKDMFLGNFRLDLVHPFPISAERPEFAAF